MQHPPRGTKLAFLLPVFAACSCASIIGRRIVNDAGRLPLNSYPFSKIDLFHGFKNYDVFVVVVGMLRFVGRS